MPWTEQVLWMFILPIPVACISWTFTHEELFREIHDYLSLQSTRAKSVLPRKFFYMLTCEFCFSHYVTIGFLALTSFKLLSDTWVGYVIAGFSTVWFANVYMSLYAFLRTDLKKEKIQTEDMSRKQENTWKNR